MLELALAGESQRTIAEVVFGDKRLHGRVERIIADERRRERLPRASEAPRRKTLPTGEELFARFVFSLDARLDAGERVSASEIAQVLKMEILLENRQMVERMRELTGEPRDDVG